MVFGTFHRREHFSLAMALHLAIMSGQLAKEWGVVFQRVFANARAALSNRL
jgi:thiazole synthase ThiGH ThiG subunit